MLEGFEIEIFTGSGISEVLRSAKRYDDFELIKNTCQAACHDKTEPIIFVKFKKTSKNRCRPTCRCHHLGYFVPPALHRTIWFGMFKPIEAKRVQMVTVDFT